MGSCYYKWKNKAEGQFPLWCRAGSWHLGGQTPESRSPPLPAFPEPGWNPKRSPSLGQVQPACVLSDACQRSWQHPGGWHETWSWKHWSCTRREKLGKVLSGVKNAVPGCDFLTTLLISVIKQGFLQLIFSFPILIKTWSAKLTSHSSTCR